MVWDLLQVLWGKFRKPLLFLMPAVILVAVLAYGEYLNNTPDDLYQEHHVFIEAYPETPTAELSEDTKLELLHDLKSTNNADGSQNTAEKAIYKQEQLQLLKELRTSS